MKKTLLLVLGIFALSTLPLLAKGPGPCKEDIKKFCAEVKPGEGRIIKCLKEHENELSESCKTHKAVKKEEHNKFKAACKDDIKKLCKDGKGKGAKIGCLKANEASLSEKCKAELNKPIDDKDVTK